MLASLVRRPSHEAQKALPGGTAAFAMWPTRCILRHSTPFSFLHISFTLLTSLARSLRAIVLRAKPCRAFVMPPRSPYFASLMSTRYKIQDQEGLYYITITLTGWVDLFIRTPYRDCIIDSFQYCKKHKGLRVHAYVIMTSHIHAIVSAEEGYNLTNTIRDFKKFTSKALIELIKEIPESRRVWMLNKFAHEADRTSRGDKFIVWKPGYHAKQIETEHFMLQKLNYIHNNPVKAGFVDAPEDFLYSSARNYADIQGVMEVEFLY